MSSKLDLTRSTKEITSSFIDNHHLEKLPLNVVRFLISNCFCRFTTVVSCINIGLRRKSRLPVMMLKEDDNQAIVAVVVMFAKL